MKLNSLLIAVAGALALAGCSSTSTQVDAGRIPARTFSFVNRGTTAPAGVGDQRQHVHSMIQTAIRKNLAAHGVAHVDSGGDVTVSYLVVVGNNVSTTSVNDYFGYGANAQVLLEKAHKAYTGTKNPNYFEAGTLVIDIVDGKDFKVLKRGHATRPILRSLPDDARQARIQEVVDEILRDVRFGP